MTNLKDLLVPTKALVKSVGRYQLQEAKKLKLDQIESKGFNDLVSYVDKESEKKLVAGLASILPSSDFLTEEGNGLENGADYTWIIDPLDGTTNFVQGLPLYSVSVALRHKNDIVMGIVYEPNRDECFTAVRNEGAFLNGQKLKIRSELSPQQALFATGFPYSLLGKEDAHFLIMRDLVMNTRGLRRFGSAAVDLCYVAANRFGGYFEFNLNPYDVAAGALIVQEAGGMVTNYSNNTDNWFNGEEIVATCPAVHQFLIDSIQKHW